MSEEARRLVDGLATAVGWNKHNSTELLLAYIERIDRERDEALEKAELSATRLVSECDRSEQKDKRIAELEAENARLREDAERYEYLRNVSECDRSEQKDKRIAELEAENARLRQISTQRGAKMQLLREYFTPTEWHNFVGIRPEAAAWFDSDGVPIDAARKL